MELRWTSGGRGTLPECRERSRRVGLCPLPGVRVSVLFCSVFLNSDRTRHPPHPCFKVLRIGFIYTVLEYIKSYCISQKSKSFINDFFKIENDYVTHTKTKTSRPQQSNVISKRAHQRCARTNSTGIRRSTSHHAQTTHTHNYSCVQLTHPGRFHSLSRITQNRLRPQPFGGRSGILTR